MKKKISLLLVLVGLLIGSFFIQVLFAGSENALEEVNKVHSGEITYYGPDSNNPIPADSIFVGIDNNAANCGGYVGDDLEPTRNYCAMNDIDLRNLQLMGGYIEITGANGKETFMIVDKLPVQISGNVDIYSEINFNKVANSFDGRVEATWKIVSNPFGGMIEFRFEKGSTEDWANLQIFNHTYPISKVEFKNSIGTYETMTRAFDGGNFFKGLNMGKGPYTIRLTDIYGQIIEENGVNLQSSAKQKGIGNFPIKTTDSNSTSTYLTTPSKNPTPTNDNLITEPISTITSSTKKYNTTNTSINYSTWKSNKSYTMGDLVEYNGVIYKCIMSQSHASPDWNPENTKFVLWIEN